MVPQPIYWASNCNVAYQLNWTLSIFGRMRLPSPEKVIDGLRAALVKDELKILEFRSLRSDCAQFYISSRPKHSPSDIIRSIKGRWQYLMRDIEKIEFRRNYHIRSIGSAKSSVLDEYVAKQNARHPMGDPDVQKRLESLQFFDPAVDPERIRRSAYGEFGYALQIVVETDRSWVETCGETLAKYREAIISTCSKHEWSLSRIGLLSNHMHILLAAGVNESPEEIALELLNSLAYTQAMKPIFRFSYYVGTFGEYDRGAIWNTMRKDNVSEDRSVFQLV